MKYRHLSLALCSLLLSLIVSAFAPDGIAQTGEEDASLTLRDNPTGRAEFERMRRADPAIGRIPEGIRGKELAFAAGIPTREQVMSDGLKGGWGLLSASIDWRERGPSNQGGRTRALGVDVTNEGVILAGGVSGGMWRSEDTGGTWTRVTDIGEMQSVTCLVQDPRPGSQHIWYYGTGEQRANSADLPGDGIFKSTDGGRSWKRLASTVRNTPQSRDQMLDYVHAIAVDPSNLNRDELYAACYGGIVRSTDGGESWEPVLGSLGNSASYTDVAVTSEGVVYATISSNGRQVKGIWRSEDGTDWTDITPPGFPTTYGKLSIGIAPSNENRAYFFGHTSGAGKNDHSLWTYERKGTGEGIWEDRSEGLPSSVETYSSYCVVVRVKPDNEDVVFLGHVGIHRSTNGFRTTSATASLMGTGQHADQHEFVFFPSDPDRMLSGHDGGVSITANNAASPVRWESLNNGYATTQFYSVAIDPTTSGSLTIIGGTQDNGSWFLNDDEERTDWVKIFGADGGYSAISDGGEGYYTSYQNGQIYRSRLRDDGSRIAWSRIDPEGGEDYFFIHPFTLDPSATHIMYLPEGRNIWRNDNLLEIPLENRSLKTDVNWTLLSKTQVPPGFGSVSAVGVSRDNTSHRLYYGTNVGRLYKLEGADTGDPKPTAVTDERMEGGYINSIAVNPENGDQVLLAVSNYGRQSLYYTADGGETWDVVGGNLEEFPDGKGNGPSVSWAAILPINGQIFYLAGTSTGLYSTTLLNGEETFWVQEGASTIGNVVVDMIAVRPSDGFVAVGTHGRGVFSANVAQAFVKGTLKLSGGTLNFGEVEIGTTALDSIIVTNLQSSEREIRLIVADPESPFSVISGGGSFSLAPGEVRSIVFGFTPDSATLVSASVPLVHDATSPASPSTIWLSGKGVRSSTNSVDDSERLAGLISAFESVPNRFSRRTTIRLRLSMPGQIALGLYDVEGRLIERLTEGKLEAGEHRWEWEPTDQPNGVYYLRLQTPFGMKTLPVVLER